MQQECFSNAERSCRKFDFAKTVAAHSYLRPCVLHAPGAGVAAADMPGRFLDGKEFCQKNIFKAISFHVYLYDDIFYGFHFCFRADVALTGNN